MNWKKLLAWSAIGIASLLLVLFVAGVIVVHSGWFRQYVLTKIESTAQTYGLNLKAKSFDLDPRTLTAKLNGVIVHGTESTDRAPLLAVQNITVDVNVTSVLRQNWYLNRIEMRRPVIHMYIDKDGKSNLPTLKSKGSSGTSTNLFDLAIRHVLLTNGEVYVNDQKTPLEANLHDLEFQSTYADRNGGQYSGTLSYDNGKIKYGNYSPLAHNLRADFVANSSGAKIDPAILELGGSTLRLAIDISDYTPLTVQATYNADINAEKLRSTLRNASIPQGTIKLSGNVLYKSLPGKSLLDTATIQGTISSPELAVNSGQGKVIIRNLSANYRVAEGDAVLQNLHAALFGGQLNGEVTVHDITGTMNSQLHGSVNAISLGALSSTINTQTTNKVNLSGFVNGQINAHWTRSMKDLVARMNATILGNASPTAPGAGTNIPVNGNINAVYTAANNNITLNNTTVQTPQTTVGLNGRLGKSSQLNVNMRSMNLHEFQNILEAFSPPKPGTQSQPLGLYGSGSFSGTVTGTTAAPELRGHLTAQNLKVRGSSWRSLSANINASPSKASLQNGSLVAQNGGRINFNVSAGLNHWSFTPNNQLKVSAQVSQLPAAQIAQITGNTTKVSGLLNGKIQLSGTQQNPIGNGNLTLSNGEIASQKIKSAQLDFKGAGTQIQGTVNVGTAAGTANGELSYNTKTQAYNVSVDSVKLNLSKLEALKSLGLAGNLNVKIQGNGNVKNPEFVATLDVPELQVSGQKINNVQLQGQLKNHVASFTLNSQAVNSFIRAKGTVGLRDGYPADITLDTANIPLRPIFAMYLPAQANMLNGVTQIHATVSGPLKDKAKLTAHVVVPVLKVNYSKGIELAAVSPIEADYRGGTLSLQPAEIKGTGTDLKFQGKVPIVGGGSSTLAMNGTVNLKVAEIFRPDLTSSGLLRLDVRAVGTPKSPVLSGEIRLENASVFPAGAPMGIQNANGVIAVSDKRLDIKSFQAEFGGGTITAQGGMQYRPSLHFDLGAKASNVSFLYSGGVRTGFDADLGLTGTTDAALLRGQVTINQLSFTPDFDLASLATSAGVEAPPAPEQGFTSKLKLSIGVQNSSQMNLVSRTLSIRANANLRVTGTAANPVIVGRTNLNGGDLIFMGNRYILQGGTIDFVNPTRTEPVVNVSVGTTIDQYNINMRFQGPVDKLRTAYTSVPALPSVDIINLLAFGKTTEAAQNAPSAPGTLGAESLLASGVASQLSGKIEKIAGISQLSIDPVLGGSQRNPGAHIAVKQRVTSNLFVTFATDLTSAQNQEVLVQYQINRRWSVNANRDQNGGFGFGARVHKNW